MNAQEQEQIIEDDHNGTELLTVIVKTIPAGIQKIIMGPPMINPIPCNPSRKCNMETGSILYRQKETPIINTAINQAAAILEKAPIKSPTFVGHCGQKVKEITLPENFLF
ncbi:hypothetical protein [Sphingobium sp. KCTC 72723]|uniref:hypothetical protein n=1 Tax=Sphingobium sp. KCTC 72723 TaxID=2733867 RepID=UPI00165E1821|nr:hypothetical protein [Sphingobium sp. KCTC 72723]